MQDWIILVEKARRGDLGSFDALVVKFKDMAIGYAYSLLKDFHLAEDAAQEAFIQAFRDLPSLKEARAFPSWFRRLVFKFCDRIKRRKTLPIVAMDTVLDQPDKSESQDLILEKKERHAAVFGCIEALPETERTVTTLFYINGYSVAEVGNFLDEPLTTVKSRLFSARKQLRKRMVTMIKETLREQTPDDRFNARIRQVLAKVPVIDFDLYRQKEKSGIPRCPETVPFPSCLRAYLEFIGQGYDPKIIDAHGRKWRLDNSYVMAMGTSGAAFKLNWKPGWHPEISAVLCPGDDAWIPQKKALDAMGISYEVLENDGRNRDVFVDKIRESVHKNSRPCIARGVVGPPEECLITGFDRNGEVLIGWSFFQKAKEFLDDVKFEANGYFRRRNWYENTQGLLVLGDRREIYNFNTTCLAVLEWAVQVMETPVVHGDMPSGIAAYQAWIDTIMDDREFENKKVKELVSQYWIHSANVGLLAECRWYCHLFLERIKAEVPFSEKLGDAAGCFMDIHDTMWKVWNAVGGMGVNATKAKKFADPQIRIQVAGLLKEARRLDEKALGYLKSAISKQ